MADIPDDDLEKTRTALAPKTSTGSEKSSPVAKTVAGPGDGIQPS